MGEGGGVAVVMGGVIISCCESSWRLSTLAALWRTLTSRGDVTVTWPCSPEGLRCGESGRETSLWTPEVCSLGDRSVFGGSDGLRRPPPGALESDEEMAPLSGGGGATSRLPSEPSSVSWGRGGGPYQQIKFPRMPRKEMPRCSGSTRATYIYLGLCRTTLFLFEKLLIDSDIISCRHLVTYLLTTNKLHVTCSYCTNIAHCAYARCNWKKSHKITYTVG